jgi:CMP/dCMP kinase
MTERRKLIIAIDGPAGSGKSTVAKLLAARLQYAYIDTGAMYRAVTLKAMREGRDLTDAAAVEAAARAARLEFVPGKAGKMKLDGADVSDAIRTPEVSRLVSAHVANYPGVRRVLVARQRELGAAGGVVMEGRDITTVVFPQAEIKIFLSASQEERARRRFQELQAQGVEQPYDELLADLQRRDLEDQQRPGGALRCAPGAKQVDTTGLTIEQVVETILRAVRTREQATA